MLVSFVPSHDQPLQDRVTMNEDDQQVYGELELVPHNRDPYNNNDFLKVCERFITHVWVH